MMEWLTSIIIAWLNTDSETARIIASSSMGVVLTILAVSVLFIAMPTGKGAGNLLTSAGKSGENLTESVKIGTAQTTAGVQSLFSTPEHYIKASERVSTARINADKQGGRAFVKDAHGNEAGVEVSGAGSLNVLANVVDSLGHVTGKVIPPAYARMISQNNNGEVE